MNIRPGPRLIFWALAASAPSLLAPLSPSIALMSSCIAWAVLAALVLQEYWFLQSASLWAQRAEEYTISIGESETLSIKLSSHKTLSLRIRQILPDILGGRSTSTQIELNAAVTGKEQSASIIVCAHARGSATLPATWIATTRWGLVEKLSCIDSPCSINVLPNLRAIARLHKELNNSFLRGLGQRMSPRVGNGREFDQLRDYVRGDDYRHISWKASARLGRPIVRSFRVERSQDILVCCDAGHRMAAGVNNLTRCDHAINACIALAYLANRMEDRIGLLGFSDEVEHGVAQGRGNEHLRMLTRFAAGINPDFRHSDYTALAVHLRRQLKQRTLIIILTVLPEADEQQDLLRAMRMLMPRHLPMVCSLIDPDMDARATLPAHNSQELVPRLIAQDMVNGREHTCHELRRLGVPLINSSAEDIGTNTINAYLDIKRRQVL